MKEARLIFKKEYEGFESLSDIGRDVSEAFDKDFNPDVAFLPGEFQGTVRVIIEYIELETK